MKADTEACKACSMCGAAKPLAAFYADARNRSGYASECKQCHALYTAEWRRRNPEKAQAIARAAMKRYHAKRSKIGGAS